MNFDYWEGELTVYDANEDVLKAKEANQRAWLYRSQGRVSCLDEVITIYAQCEHKDDGGVWR